MDLNFPEKYKPPIINHPGTLEKLRVHPKIHLDPSKKKRQKETKNGVTQKGS